MNSLNLIVSIILFSGLIAVFSATASGQDFTNCFYQFLPEPNNNPIYCYELKFSKGSDSTNPKSFRKYTYGEENRISGWIENYEFYNLTDALAGYSETKLNYDKFGNAISLTNSNAIEKITYQGQYSYDSKPKKIVGTVKSKETTTVEFDCNEKTITYKNNNGRIIELEKQLGGLSKEISVFFEQTYEGKTTIKEVKTRYETKILKKDKFGNPVELITTNNLSSFQEKIYRHYIYPEDNLDETRTIEEVISEYVKAYKNGNFDILVDEFYINREEAIQLNAPYLGKTDFQGILWIINDAPITPASRIKKNHLKIRTKKRLNWPELRLEKITEKEVRQGGYKLGKDIFNGNCTFKLTDGERNMTVNLMFLKLHNKWFIYVQ